MYAFTSARSDSAHSIRYSLKQIMGVDEGWALDWLQSFKQIFIHVPYHILVASVTLMALLATSI